MSTPQVPGYVASNNDALHDGCWAERVHASGAIEYLYIDHIEAGLVRYHEFIPGPVTAAPAVRVMTLQGFGAAYSDAGWTWHDKSVRPVVESVR